ncbi:MAG: 3-phosphoshikimate 1-carboxyvinyltransferase, partial [Candidatus Omnitrophica bacterium]|nr:3-phosphoshikimate 1-carboxyvinyltransferase [Candidatus Omnitrophota bacterium]
MYTVVPLSNVKTRLSIPPDKSISHRALMLASIAQGTTTITPFIPSNDTAATLACLKKLGVTMHQVGRTITITGQGIYYNKNKPVTLNAQESGTTLRILSGILAGQCFPVTFASARSLAKRPMSRITVPLRAMGADIHGRLHRAQEYPPLSILPAAGLVGISYRLPIPSAQIKSAIMLAALYAHGETKIYEPVPCRDHT